MRRIREIKQKRTVDLPVYKIFVPTIFSPETASTSSCSVRDSVGFPTAGKYTIQTRCVLSQCRDRREQRVEFPRAITSHTLSLRWFSFNALPGLPIKASSAELTRARHENSPTLQPRRHHENGTLAEGAGWGREGGG